MTDGTPPSETITGTSLYVPLSPSSKERRDGMTRSTEDLVDALQATADANGGHVLYLPKTKLHITYRAQVRATSIIIHDTISGKAFTGIIRRIGADHAPGMSDGPYRPPVDMRSPIWVEVDGGRTVMFDRGRYVALTADRKVRDLSDTGLRSCHLIRPRGKADATTIRLLPRLDPVGDTGRTRKPTGRVNCCWYRIGRATNHGVGASRQQVDDGTVIRWNPHGTMPTYLRILADHADSHDGRLLLLIDDNLTMKTIGLCERLILCEVGGESLEGSITEVGDHWRGDRWTDGDYTQPALLRFDHAAHWVKLDDVSWSPRFDPSPYRLNHPTSPSSIGQPLADVIDGTAASRLILVKEVSA